MSVGNIESELERTGLLVRGAGAPTDSAAGYKVGAVYVDETNDIVYINTGTEASSIWKQMVSTAATQTLTGKSGVLKPITASNVTTGMVARKVMSATAFKALLVGTDNYDLFPVSLGDVILEVGVCITGQGGDSVTLTIGADKEATGTTDDPDGLLKAVDANTLGMYVSTNSSYDGDLLPVTACQYTVVGAGNVTVTPSAKLSDVTAFGGFPYMLYIPA